MLKRFLLTALLAFLAPLALAQNVPVPIGPSGGGTVANPLSGAAGGTGVANTGKTFTLQGSYTLGGTTGSTLNMGAGGTLGYFAFGTDASHLTGTLPSLGLPALTSKYVWYGNPSNVTTAVLGTAYVFENMGYATLNAAVAALGTSTPATLTLSSNYTLTSSLTVPSNINLIFLNGGKITKASTYTLTINGQLQAPLSQIFSGFSSGNVTLARSTNNSCYPEWWYNGGGDWLVALNSALVAGCPNEPLQGKNYPISATWKITTGNVHVYGVSLGTSTANYSTRIIVTGSTADVVQLGPDTDPGAVLSYQASNELDHISFGRTAEPISPSTLNSPSGAAGLRAQYLIEAKIHDNISEENTIGFYIRGVVHTAVDDNYSNRGADDAGLTSVSRSGTISSSSTTVTGISTTVGLTTGGLVTGANIPVGTTYTVATGTTVTLSAMPTANATESLTFYNAAPYHTAYFLDGCAGTIPSCTGVGGGSNGNESLYMFRNQGGTNPALIMATTTGVWAYGLFVDSFINFLEISTFRDGINAIGITGCAVAYSTNCKAGNADLRIIHATIDGFTRYGINIQTPSPYSAILVTNSYAAPSGSAEMFSASYFLNNCSSCSVTGNVQLVANQAINWPNPATYGIYSTYFKGVHSVGNIILGSNVPEAVISPVSSEYSDFINNPTGTASEAAVFVQGSLNSYFKPSIVGATNAFPQCVNLDSASTYTQVDVSLVTPGACNSIPLYYNSGAITARGAFGTGNLATGTNLTAETIATTRLTGTLQAGQFPALTGDLTTSAGALATTLATVNSNVGSFGSATNVGSFAVDAKGRITAAANVPITAPAGALTGATLAANVLASSLTSVGTLTGGATGAGFTIQLNTSTITGTVPTAVMPAFTGDITTSAGSLATTLATVATGATTGSSTAIPIVTFNNKGLVTAITTAAVIAPAGTLSGATLNSGVTASSLTSTGTLVGGATGAGFTVNLGTSTISGTLPQANDPALTGDVTKAAGNAATTLATVATGATTGSSTAIPIVTFNNKGLVTAITTAAVIAPAGTLSGATLNSGVTASSLTSVGTITTGVWNAGTVTSSGIINAAAASGYQLGGSLFANTASSQNRLYDTSGTPKITIALTVGATNYANTAHNFYSQDFGAAYAVVDASGIKASGGTLQATGYTVATLPSSAGTGMVTGARTHVTDQLTTCPVLGGAFTGGGAVVCSAFYTGAAWTHQ